MPGPSPRSAESNEGSAADARDPARREAADYIASLLESLRVVALDAKRPFLAYLIGMALEEAKSDKGGA